MTDSTSLENQIAIRLAATREIIQSLLIASRKGSGSQMIQILALAERIKYCSEPGNHFIAKEAFNKETGEVYEATGTLWSCGSKLCPQCLSAEARRKRKRLREALEKQKLRKGERYYFLTLTMPNPNLGILETRSLVNRAWSLFRKRKLCVSLFRGGCKSEEFTITPNGFHYHLHLLLIAKFTLFQEVRRVWTECLEQSFLEEQIKLEFRTKDGLAIVKMKQITDLEKSVQEVCKYITKSDSWLKMKAFDLAELALIRRWNRMFELFGCFSNREQSEPIVHTRSISDGSQQTESEYWRDVVDEIGLTAYRERLIDEIARTREWRLQQLREKWPGSEIKTLS